MQRTGRYVVIDLYREPLLNLDIVDSFEYGYLMANAHNTHLFQLVIPKCD